MNRMTLPENGRCSWPTACGLGSLAFLAAGFSPGGLSLCHRIATRFALSITQIFSAQFSGASSFSVPAFIPALSKTPLYFQQLWQSMEPVKCLKTLVRKELGSWRSTAELLPLTGKDVEYLPLSQPKSSTRRRWKQSAQPHRLPPEVAPDRCAIMASAAGYSHPTPVSVRLPDEQICVFLIPKKTRGPGRRRRSGRSP